MLKEAESGEDEDIVGPMPAKGPVDYSVTAEFEKRAQRMKEKLTKGDDVSFQNFLLIYFMHECFSCMHTKCMPVYEEVKRGNQTAWNWING